eukprot:1161656-Pelagomonas_calceolata.AAC.3
MAWWAACVEKASRQCDLITLALRLVMGYKKDSATKAKEGQKPLEECGFCKPAWCREKHVVSQAAGVKDASNIMTYMEEQLAAFHHPATVRSHA